MNATEANAEVFMTAFRALSKKEKKHVLESLLKDKEFMEDLTDIVIFDQRINESSRSLEEYIADRKKI